MATVAHTLELLAAGHRDTIKGAVVKLMTEVAKHPEELGVGEKLTLLLHVGLHSSHVLQLVAGEALRISAQQKVAIGEDCLSVCPSVSVLQWMPMLCTSWCVQKLRGRWRVSLVSVVRVT